MPAAQGLYAEKVTDTTANSTTWVDVCQIDASSFTAGKKYLILALGYMSCGSGTSDARMRLVHGTTPTEFTDFSSSFEVGVNAKKALAAFMTVWTQPGTAELIKLQISNEATATTTCHLGQIFALKLSDDFTENTDWFFNEVLTDYLTTVNLSDTSSTEAASVTFTPNGTDDWLVIGNFVLTPASVTTNYIASLFDSVEGVDQPMLNIEGEDTATENRTHVLARVWTPSNASHTFQLRFAHESTVHTIKSSRIFAINLNKFNQHAFTYNAAEEQPAATPSWTTTRTLSQTPSVTGDWFVLGYFDNDVGATADDLATRLQINSSGSGLASNPAYGDDAPTQDTSWDNTDVIPVTLFKLLSLSSGASRQINLDVQMVAGTTLRVENRTLVAFSLELATAGTPASDSQPAYAQGKDTSSDGQPAYAKGQDTASDGQPAYLYGQEIASDSQPAYLAGTADGLDSQPAYAQGQDAALDSQPVYLYGQGIALDSQPAYLAGTDTGVDSQPAYAQGQDVSLDSQPAYAIGQDTAVDSQACYLSGSQDIADSQPAYLEGLSEGTPASDGQPAYMSGQSTESDSQPAYAQGQDTSLDNQPAYLYGQGVASDSQSAYVQGQDFGVDGQSAYILGQATDLDSQPAYVIGQDTAIDAQACYLSGSQDAVDSQSAYLEGFSAGGTPTSDYQPAYLAGQNTESDSQPAYLVGQAQGSDYQPAYLIGGVPGMATLSDTARTAATLSDAARTAVGISDIQVGDVTIEDEDNG